MKASRDIPGFLVSNVMTLITPYFYLRLQLRLILTDSHSAPSAIAGYSIEVAKETSANCHTVSKRADICAAPASSP